MPQPGVAALLSVPGRDQEEARYVRDYSLRNPSAKTGDNTQPRIDAKVMSDTTAPQYANAVTIANNCSRQTMTGPQLDDEALALGTSRFPAVGASGAVIITATTGGTTILAGDEFKIGSTRYQCAATATYNDGDEVPITGIDVGPGTNQRPGVVGKWSAPRPGCGQNATVAEQADGTGLTGGNPVETDDQLRQRLDDIAANPPASGNDAEYQQLILRTPGVAVQKTFTFPAIKGGCSIGAAYTLRPAQPGAGRIPNPTQMAATLAWIKGQMPAQDGIYLCTIVSNPVLVNLAVTWAQGASGWVDAQPWPPYESGGPIAVDGSTAPTATAFNLTGNNGTNPAPQVGQTIGVFDLPNLVFRKKRITSVTPSGLLWQITSDPSTSVNDTTYVPIVGQVVCPWSDSLDSLVTPVASYMDTLGPGEQLATNQFVDPGLRQRRSPPNPGSWPSTLSNRLIQGVLDLSSVQDALILSPAVPYAAPIGTPGTSSFMTTLSSLAAFPE